MADRAPRFWPGARREGLARHPVDAQRCKQLSVRVRRACLRGLNSPLPDPGWQIFNVTLARASGVAVRQHCTHCSSLASVDSVVALSASRKFRISDFLHMVMINRGVSHNHRCALTTRTSPTLNCTYAPRRDSYFATTTVHRKNHWRQRRKRLGGKRCLIRSCSGFDPAVFRFPFLSDRNQNLLRFRPRCLFL